MWRATVRRSSEQHPVEVLPPVVPDVLCVADGADRTTVGVMGARVRDFLYLDHTLVAQTLSQLDFGVFKEWEETLERASGKEGSAGLTLWGAANIGAGSKRSQTEGSTVVLQQTAESYAARLLLRLEEEDQLLRLGDEPALELRRGSIFLTEGVAEPFELERLVLTEWSQTVQGQLGSLNTELEELEQPAPLEPVKAAIIVRRAGKGLVVVARLLPGHLRVPIYEILGDAVEMVASVRRVHGSDAGGFDALIIARPIAIY
jgi:class 3 adenylate cyclase